jgi:diguanylate cyclase (GGDEF)-like protein/PAS domain S-box-containing protein
MDGESVDFYWLSASGAGPPRGLADLVWQREVPDGGASQAPSVVFINARKTDGGEWLQRMRGRFGDRACLVVLLAVCEPDLVEALLDQGADDVCSARELRHPTALLARARRNALRKGSLDKRAEASLQDGEQRYREVFEHASDAIFLVDVTADGRFKFAGHNPSAQRIFSFVNEESIGKNIEDLLPPPIAAQSTRRYRECLRAGATTRFEESLDLPDGTHWFVFNLIPMRAEGTTIHRILGIGRDVSDEKLLDRVRRQRELEFRAFIEDSPDIVVRYDRACRRSYVNSAYRVNCRIPVEQALGKTPRELGPFAPAEAQRYEQALLRVQETAMAEEIELSLLGGEIFHSLRIFPDRNTAGEITGVVSISRDVSDRVKAEQRLERREQEFRTLVENTPDTIARYDRECRRLYVNPALARTLESDSGLLGRTPAEGSRLIDPEQYIVKIKEVFSDGCQREYECASITPDGDTKWQLLRLVPEYDQQGEVATVLAIGRDITEIIENRSIIQRMAFFDSLTGLPNRSLLNDSIQKLVADVRAGGRQFGLMLLDLDRFKEVNDTLGHAAGDALLCEVAARLRACAGGSDVVARLGGDEFAILLPDRARKADLLGPAARILTSLAEPFHVEGYDVIVTTSIGITKCRPNRTDVEMLFKEADSAMYHAKRMGRNNFQFHKPEMTARIANG